MLSDLRRYPRFFLPGGLRAQLEQADANVVDLSVKGARVQVNQALNVGAKVGLSLITGDGPISTAATVLWCQMAALALDDDESDVYLAGVMFDEALPIVETILDSMVENEAAIAIVDARSTERYCITVPLHGTFGEDGGEVKVVDLSTRGARIIAREPIAVGTTASVRFRLEPGPAVDVIGKVIWCNPADRKRGYSVGISIPGEEALLRAVIAQMCMRKQARVDMNSLRRKFDPMRSAQRSGVLALAS